MSVQNTHQKQDVLSLLLKVTPTSGETIIQQQRGCLTPELLTPVAKEK